MKDLYLAVARQLKAQRDPDDALKLWETLRDAYEAGGTEGLAASIEEIVLVPAEEEQS